MLEKIEIINFQGTKRLVLTLDEFCTTLVGDNDAGKSTVLRALRWCWLNQPAGDSFIRRVGDEKQYPCVVRTWVDGHVLSRHRTDKENWYELDGQRYSALGRDVPDPIRRLLMVDSHNWRGQHDSVFWFSDTAGQVSKALNEIVNLDAIDSSLAAAASAVRGARAEVQVSESRLKQAEEKRESLKWVLGYDKALRRVESLKADYEETAARREGLALLIQTVQDLTRQQKSAALAAQSGKKLLLIGQEAQEAGRKATSLRKSIQEYKRLKAVLTNPAPTIDLLPVPPEPDPKLESLRDSIEEYKKWQTEYDLASREGLALRNELEKITRSGCPLCGSPMSGSSRSRAGTSTPATSRR